jgi:hypothetical protein
MTVQYSRSFHTSARLVELGFSPVNSPEVTVPVSRSTDTVVETFTAPNTAFVDCGTPGGVAALDFVTAIAITL